MRAKKSLAHPCYRIIYYCLKFNYKSFNNFYLFDFQIIDDGYGILDFLSGSNEIGIFIFAEHLHERFQDLANMAITHFHKYVKPVCLNLRSSVKLRKTLKSL